MSNKNNNISFSKNVVKKINQLYILKRKKFLLMTKKGYITITYDGQKRNQTLDWRVESHLRGRETLGVFAGSIFTKFICFDVDVKNQEIAKWAVYKLVESLISIGIPQEYIYISYSGSKGYHVEIFFDKPIYNEDIHRFYLMALNKAELLNFEHGQVELRPTETQGVKIPLGKHQKSGNICWYCDYGDKLKLIKNYDYVLTIKQLDSKFFYLLFNNDNFNISEEKIIEFEEIKDQHKPLKQYDENINEEFTLESMSKLYKEGLTIVGSRHNSLLKLAKFFKHHGLNAKETKFKLIEWMKWQNKSLYNSTWEEVLKDIDGICNSKYFDKYTLVIKNTDIQITKEEIEQILKVKGKSEKLLLYAMLIHKKRYATKDGIFFMTYSQMAELTGLTKRTNIRLVKKLESLNIIEVNRSEEMYYNNNLKKPTSKPNKYKLILLGDIMNSSNKSNNNFNVCDKECKECFYVCLCKIYSNNEVKKILNKNQYNDIRLFRNKQYNSYNYSCIK